MKPIKCKLKTMQPIVDDFCFERATCIENKKNEPSNIITCRTHEIFYFLIALFTQFLNAHYENGRDCANIRWGYVCVFVRPLICFWFHSIWYKCSKCCRIIIYYTVPSSLSYQIVAKKVSNINAQIKPWNEWEKNMLVYL